MKPLVMLVSLTLLSCAALSASGSQKRLARVQSHFTQTSCEALLLDPANKFTQVFVNKLALRGLDGKPSLSIIESPKLPGELFGAFLKLNDRTAGSATFQHNKGILSFDIYLAEEARKLGAYSLLLAEALRLFPDTRFIPSRMSVWNSDNAALFFAKLPDHPSRRQTLAAFKELPCYRARKENGFAKIRLIEFASRKGTLSFISELGEQNDEDTIVRTRTIEYNPRKGGALAIVSELGKHRPRDADELSKVKEIFDEYDKLKEKKREAFRDSP